MDDDSDRENSSDDDFYAFLNVPKNATQEEIQNAYRRQSRIYHPDKHADPAWKKDAEMLFNRTKRAYEVLSNPHQRAIYDSLGIRGLETEGWEIVQRTKTPQELREEYERLAKEREEKRLEMRTNPRGSLTINVNATDMFNRYDDYEDDSPSLLSTIEVSGMSVSQSIEVPLTVRNTAMLYGALTTKNGVGSGTIDVSVRRVMSPKSWVEVGCGAGNGLALNLKGYRALTKKLFFNGQTMIGMGSNLVRSGVIGTLAMQLDTYTVGHLTYRLGIQSGMNTTIVRDTANNYTAISVEFGLLRSYLSLNYIYKMEEKQLKLKGCVKAGTFGAFVEYGVEKKVSRYSTLSAIVHVGVPTGVTLKLKLSRAYQTYSFPIHLSDELLPAPVFYATVAPLITWTLVKNFIIDPIVQERKQRDKEKQRELNKTKILEKQREAKAAVELMKATFSRIRSEEEGKRGLIITKALYGRFVYPQERTVDENHTSAHRDEVIDVTIPLQCLVKDSKLVLHTTSKHQLPGFYDPCIGEEKQLLLQYLFHSQTHECLIKDDEPLRIPKQ